MEYTISDRDFDLYAKLVYDKTGINLMNKKQLLQSRINKILRIRNLDSYRAYYEIIKNDNSGQELEDFINLISTNVTHFFREEKHFSFLQNQWKDSFDFRYNNHVRIWCAASSTGEEPYSLAITMTEIIGDKFDFEIFCSDIDTKCLARVAKGIYAFDAVAQIDKDLLNKYFQVGKGKAVGYVKVKDSLKKHLKIERVNLIEPFRLSHKFDIIFCRNVMIYFDIPTKQNIIDKFYEVMNPGAFLMIGHSESLNGINHPMKYIQPAVYKKEAH